MNQNHEDLWPSEFPDPYPSDTAPVALLKEQAELLGSKTDGDIVGFVQVIIENKIAYHTLFLRAVPLGGEHMFGILTISYPVSGARQEDYPITADFIAGMRDMDLKTEVKINNGEEFRKWLREQLSSHEVIVLIGRLKKYISEVREARTSWAG
jgi:hypothetical protein